MAKPAEILMSRVDDRLQKLRQTRYWLSMEISDRKQHGIFTDIERRGTMPGSARLARIAEVLGTTTDYLLGVVDNPAPPRSEVSFSAVPQGVRDRITGFREAPDDRIPVLGTGYCDDWLVPDEDGGEIGIERFMLEIDHVVQLIARPPALFASRDAYAIYYHGASMEPRFYQGDLGIVDPRRPPSPGDDVVVQINDGESDTVQTVLVKQLVRIAGDHVELRQFNPDITFRVKRTRVTRLHRICTNNDLFG